MIVNLTSASVSLTHATLPIEVKEPTNPVCKIHVSSVLCYYVANTSFGDSLSNGEGIRLAAESSSMASLISSI